MLLHPTRVLASTLAASAALLLPALGQAACTARSGPGTAALIELYTSEGCSSCPPADRQLSALRNELPAGAVAVPLSLHVKYWDAIGWKDPFAQQVFSERQRWLVQTAGDRTVYTPHFFISGTALRDWTGAIAPAVQRLNAQPARADIGLRAQLSATGALVVDADAHSRVEQTSLYLAVTEGGLGSNVTRGENAGATLSHDHVARAWSGPLPLQGGRAQARHEFELPAAWRRDKLSLVAFVQDERSGSVLQALAAPGCALP